MYRTILSLFLILAAFTAAATEPTTKRDTQGYSGACQGATVADDSRITRDSLFGLNRTNSPVLVICSPVIDTSQNGSAAFGVTFSNTGARVVTVTCTARISTVGAGGTRLFTRSVMVNPQSHGGLSWASADVGEGKTYRGGQVGITCALPTGVALSNVWTRSVGN